MTPIRLNTPSLKLSSTLRPSPCRNSITAKIVPGTYNIESTETVSHSKSPRPVRLNLMSVLNQDRSSSVSCGDEINSTNMEFSATETTQKSSSKEVMTCVSNPQNTSFLVRIKNDSV